jgi:hypothetical protein
MALLLVAAASASSCCTSVGAQPTILASCDALGVALGTGADVETGGWSWDGRWTPAGDDGGADAVVSVAIMGRLAPWLQTGVRLPVNVAVQRLDGVSSTDLGVGNALVWLGMETAWSHPTSLGLEVGFGAEGPSAASPGARVLQVAARMAMTGGPSRAWGALVGRVPVFGTGVSDADASVTVDHVLGPHFRLGGGVVAEASAGPIPGFSALVGPSLTISPTSTDTVVVALRAGVPAPWLGRNAPSRVALTFDWYRALARVDAAGS